MNATPRYTPSVQSCFSKLSSQKAISAWMIVRELLLVHPEYGRGLGEKLQHAEVQLQAMKTLDEWVADLDRVIVYPGPWHGRLVILALITIDRTLNDFLQQVGFVSALEKEFREPVAQLVDRTAVAVVKTAATVELIDDEQSAGSDEQMLRKEMTSSASTAPASETMGGSAFNLKPYLNKPNFWWLQANPDYWRIDKRKVGSVVSYSTHTEKGSPRKVLQNFYNARPDDLMIIYETTPSRRIRGLATITREATDRAGDEIQFRIEYFFKKKTTWEDLKLLRSFAESDLMTNNQGSLFRLKRDEFRDIIGTTELADQIGSDVIISNNLQRPFIDNDGAFAKDDHLGFTKDIRAFATLMAMKHTKPPFAIALFGQWGTGKSFFMHHLRLTIEELSVHQGFKVPAGKEAEQPPSREKLFCEGIVQIEFNAWSYLDANLWAGLVSMIFEKLDDYIDENVPGREEKAEVEKKLSEKLQILSDQKRAILKEKEELDTERKTIARDIDRAEEGKRQLMTRIRNTSLKDLQQEALKNVKPLGDEVKKKLGEFGITEDRLAALSPNALNDEFRSWETFGKNFLKFKTKDKIIFLFAFAMFAIFVIDPRDFFSTAIHDIGKVAVMLVSLIGPVLKKWLDTFEKYKNLVAPVLEFRNNFNEQVRIAEYDHEKSLRMLQAELRETDSQINNLAVRLQAKDKEIQEVEYALKHSITKQAFFNFIQKKNDEGGYEKHLGIISTIRRDFEALSTLFKGANQGDQTIDGDVEFLRKFAKPLDRIILYIDDLDRCSDDKVVEVLQAVHLLMAYPLFIVVVGVDKRCVHNALTHRNLVQYSQFTRNGSPGLLQELGIRIIQPAEYLEKIFQIPFHVERASEDKIKLMVKSLLEGQVSEDLVVPDEDSRIQAARDLSATFQNVISATPAAAQDGRGQPEIQVPAAESVKLPTEEEVVARYLPPQDLKFTRTESICLEEMTCLVGTTPRTVKRYVNMYRIIRAHELLSYKEDMRNETFLMIMFILAINVGRYRVMADELFKHCQENPDLSLRAVLEMDTTHQKILYKIAESTQLRPLLDFPASAFAGHIRFVRRFSFDTQEQRDPEFAHRG